MKKKLFVLSGSSGVGKGTVINGFLKRNPSFSLSISCTTRNMRPGEVDGVNYFFLTKEELQELSDDFQYEFNTDRIISKAYYVDVNRMFYIKYEDGETETDNEDITVTVAKIEGKWYYIDEN